MQHEQVAYIEKLYHEYFKKLTLYAMSVLRDQNRAQDVVQDTFHEALLHIDTLMSHENPGGWLMVTVKNKVRENERARRRYLRRFLSLDTDIIVGNDPVSDEVVEISDSPGINSIELIRKTLTEEEYKLLHRFVFEKASHLEIAKEFGISVYASQKRLERIRKKLYECFPERKKKK